ncbi:M56 family metallopeptidase [Cohnella rhizosphaerae]|uniref:M56 family metallopeptidase n=1 Tax=Cohnella rhizosphaerae TaxID=1457232 RepID=A0A9X4QT59_9BACL|nr:M56 family metallopeptidase [Cohnella rhizosphaerae]MDG0810014.1 M56 family metallopeptidase [Cohnella rhizosphaerae]
MSAVFVSTLAFCASQLVREAVCARRFGSMLRRSADARLSRRYGRRFGIGRGRLAIIRAEAPVAMTVGLFRPRIVLSAGLLRMLEPAELAAVVAHERHHLRRRDPLALFALSLSRKALWYVPLLGWAEDKYKTAVEVLADRHAIASSSGGAEALGGALLKLLRQAGVGGDARGERFLRGRVGQRAHSAIAGSPVQPLMETAPCRYAAFVRGAGAFGRAKLKKRLAGQGAGAQRRGSRSRILRQKEGSSCAVGSGSFISCFSPSSPSISCPRSRSAGHCRSGTAIYSGPGC